MEKIFNLFLIIILLINSVENRLINQKINVAYGLDNKYTYPTLVSIISILENSSRYSFYNIYLLIDKNSYNPENKVKFYHLEEKYDRCKINFVEITNENLSNARVNRYPMSAYYRLLLAKVLPNVNRMIYLDGDTIIFKDLNEMFNLEMNNNILLGFVDNSYKKAKDFGIETYKYVTSGVLLMDLKKIRKEGFTQKFFDFIDQNKKKLAQEDQTVLNIVLHGRIDLIPPKFGIWDFHNKGSLLSHNRYGNKNLKKKAYDEDLLIKDYHSPTIVHYVRVKPWKRVFKPKHKEFHEKWWEYAAKADEYNNILSYYGGKK